MIIRIVFTGMQGKHIKFLIKNKIKLTIGKTLTLTKVPFFMSQNLNR